jgi:hypothetical protein
MLMKAKTTGLAISRVLVQTADWHYNEASQWWDMYMHCVTQDAWHEFDGVKVLVKNGLIHPDFWQAAQTYLRKYRYHTAIADRIMATGQPVPLRVRAKPQQPVDYAEEFEKAVEQRGMIAKQAFEARRKKRVQRETPNGQGSVATVH